MVLFHTDDVHPFCVLTVHWFVRSSGEVQSIQLVSHRCPGSLHHLALLTRVDVCSAFRGPIAKVLSLVPWHPQLECAVWYEDSEAMPTQVPKLFGIQATLTVESFLQPPECSVGLARERNQAHVVFSHCWDEVIHGLESLFVRENVSRPGEGVTTSPPP